MKFLYGSIKIRKKDDSHYPAAWGNHDFALAERAPSTSSFFFSWIQRQLFSSLRSLDWLGALNFFPLILLLLLLLHRSRRVSFRWSFFFIPFHQFLLHLILLLRISAVQRESRNNSIFLCEYNFAFNLFSPFFSHPSGSVSYPLSLGAETPSRSPSLFVLARSWPPPPSFLPLYQPFFPRIDYPAKTEQPLRYAYLTLAETARAFFLSQKQVTARGQYPSTAWLEHFAAPSSPAPYNQPFRPAGS